jgi:hypothetical protein
MKTLRVLRALTGIACGFAEAVRPPRGYPPIAHLFNNLQENQERDSSHYYCVAGRRPQVAFGFLGGRR